MKKSFADRFHWIFSPAFPWILFGVIGLVACVHRLLLGPGHFNNYIIFEYSWKHLRENVNLYAAYPGEHYDLFKYSPTFAVLMMPFTLLPRFLGLISWNMLNMLAPVWAISKLNITQKQKSLVLFIVLIELLSSVQNAQSNGIMLALIIGAFACFERNKPVLAMLLICLGFYIKLFAAVAALMLLFYPKKIKSIAAGAGFVVLLGLLPLAVVSFDDLAGQYTNWLQLLGNDPAHEQNYSIMTLFDRLLHLPGSDIFFLLPGMILLLAPLLRMKEYPHFTFRLLFLSSVLIWVVIFNHKAESPTYCIAMAGIALWFIANQRRPVGSGLVENNRSLPAPNAGVILVFILAFILVALSPTDLFPPYLRNNFVNPYSLKALMPVIIWAMITVQLLSRKDFASTSSMTQTA